MRKLDARSYRAMPWKNGGGTTIEIARSPEGESLDDFAWRISMARVASAGPFSTFAGVDRSLAVIDGAGIVLSIEGRGPTLLDRRSAPLAFPADVAVGATLVAGPIDDLNVMSRRDRYRHLLTRVRLDAETAVPLLGDRAVLVVLDGAAIVGQRATERLDRRDALVVEDERTVVVTPAPVCELLVADLWRL